MKLKVFGQELEIEGQGGTLRQRPGGILIFEKDGKQKKVHVLRRGNKFWASLDGQSLYGELLQRSASGAEESGDSDLVAQFPGKIKKVFVSEGDQVEKGQSLLQVEAMKMEFTIKAPRDGVVHALAVQPDQQLSPGDRYLEIQ